MGVNWIYCLGGMSISCKVPFVHNRACTSECIMGFFLLGILRHIERRLKRVVVVL